MGKDTPKIWTCIFQVWLTSQHVAKFDWVPFAAVGVADEKERKKEGTTKYMAVANSIQSNQF